MSIQQLVDLAFSECDKAIENETRNYADLIFKNQKEKTPNLKNEIKSKLKTLTNAYYKYDGLRRDIEKQYECGFFINSFIGYVEDEVNHLTSLRTAINSNEELRLIDLISPKYKNNHTQKENLITEIKRSISKKSCEYANLISQRNNPYNYYKLEETKPTLISVKLKRLASLQAYYKTKNKEFTNTYGNTQFLNYYNKSTSDITNKKLSLERSPEEVKLSVANRVITEVSKIKD